MAKPRLGGLGKGLDALFADNAAGSNASTLPVNEIEPNRDQPRKYFDDEALGELADSIREHGVLQPLLVRPLPNGRYQLIAGERRWRASRMVGLRELPVVIREMSDLEAMQFALIENLQREDLNPIEEAMGYRQLIDSCDMTQEKVAASVGKSRPAVANALRLLALPASVLEMVSKGRVSAGHAKALLSLEDEPLILETAAKVADDRITVREIEQLAKQRRVSATDFTKSRPEPRRNRYQELSIALSDELGRKIEIKPIGGGGSLTLQFMDDQDLCAIAELLTGQACSLPEDKTK